MNQLKDLLNQVFTDNFHQKPMLVRSPGRVNLIGEHTDYNGGFVLPAATDKAAYLAINPSDSEKGTWISVDMHERVEIDFSQIIQMPKSSLSVFLMEGYY